MTEAIREQKRGRHLSAGRLAMYEAELNKLHAELERVISTDFFGAQGQAATVTAYERCRKALRGAQGGEMADAKRRAPKSDVLDRAEYQGRRWVTRRNLHIDRLASAWLIKQFIDKRPRFYFVAEGETVEGGIPFDMFGAEFTHQGEDCTFETLIKQFGFSDDHSLGEIAEIVHDIDLKNNTFNRLEAGGINAAVLGMAKLLKDDRKLLQQSGVIFDGLYALFSGNDGKGKGKGDDDKKRGRNPGAGKRKRRA
jgi:hypothetical protein